VLALRVKRLRVAWLVIYLLTLNKKYIIFKIWRRCCTDLYFTR